MNEDSRISSAEDAHTAFVEHIDNVRAALEWSFGSCGDPDLAVTLTARSALLFIEMSLLSECREWMIRGLQLLPTVLRDSDKEMRICGALGVSSMFARGINQEAWNALDRSFDVALELNNWNYAVGMLGMLNIYLQRAGDYQGALENARRCEAIARSSTDPSASLMAKWTLGVSNFICGDLVGAQANCESALTPSPQRGDHVLRFLGYDHRVRALVIETTTLWHLGYPDRAIRVAHLTVSEAEYGGQPVPMCIAYLNACAISFFTGNLKSADEYVERTVVLALRHSLKPFHAAGIGFRGISQALRGEIDLALPGLKESLATLHREKVFNIAVGLATFLSQSLAAAGYFVEALATIDSAIELCATRGDTFSAADLFRARGQVLASDPDASSEETEHCLLKAIRLSRQRFSLSWELKAALVLAEVWIGDGRAEDAESLC